MKTKFNLLVLLVLIVAYSCSNSNNKDYIPDEEIDLSSDALLTDDSPLGEMPEYSQIRGGASDVIDRSFENSPPLIPHKVNGILPITAEDNKCLRCHMPDLAPRFEATPLPATHFTSYRPKMKRNNDGIYAFEEGDNEMVEKDLGHFNPAMYNCSQCHVPQSNATVDIDNVFNAEFRNSGNKNRSSLKKKLGEGVND
ncbi:MAG: nitrate reductase cytochrome c-type subunit; periplasmic nitrate reductase electron transfer subunit [Chlorobi bacterium]|nr:nitrate reductase cytochrome c-type subunit; periplasmic nitrate reductase electron transfer subunit [Chlorobiota bacterium]